MEDVITRSVGNIPIYTYHVGKVSCRAYIQCNKVPALILYMIIYGGVVYSLQ